MKKYIVMLGALCSLTLSSCSWLEVEPISDITNNGFWKTPDHFESFMVGAHSRFRSHSYRFSVMGEFRSDIFGEAPFGGEASQGMERFPNNSLNEENPGISNYGDFYNGINQLNLMIFQVNKSSVLDENSKKSYLAKSYGLRAFYYFQLLRTWGKVIIANDPTFGEDLDFSNLAKPVSSEDEVLSFILADIENSLTAFDNDYSLQKEKKNSWSKAASLMLKADVLLWKAKRMNGGSADVNTAKAALEDMMSHVTLSLQPNFKDVFSYENKNNSEIIFALKSENNEFSLWGDSYSGILLPQMSYLKAYYNQDGEIWNTTKDNLFGLMRLQVQRKHFESTFAEGDTRKDVTLKGVYRADGSMVACIPNKFQGTNIPGSINRAMLDDCPVYRYADALLLMAEAKAFLGESPADEINQIRRRAFGNDYFDAHAAEVAFPNQPQDADVNEAILQERLCEFFFEGKRWYDLRRFGDEYVFKYTTADKSDPRKLLWPIDKGTLTKNTALKQTPGYESATSGN